MLLSRTGHCQRACSCVLPPTLMYICHIALRRRHCHQPCRRFYATALFSLIYFIDYIISLVDISIYHLVSIYFISFITLLDIDIIAYINIFAITITLLFAIIYLCHILCFITTTTLVDIALFHIRLIDYIDCFSLYLHFISFLANRYFQAASLHFFHISFIFVINNNIFWHYIDIIIFIIVIIDDILLIYYIYFIIIFIYIFSLLFYLYYIMIFPIFLYMAFPAAAFACRCFALFYIFTFWLRYACFHLFIITLLSFIYFFHISSYLFDYLFLYIHLLFILLIFIFAATPTFLRFFISLPLSFRHVHAFSVAAFISPASPHIADNIFFIFWCRHFSVIYDFHADYIFSLSLSFDWYFIYLRLISSE